MADYTDFELSLVDDIGSPGLLWSDSDVVYQQQDWNDFLILDLGAGTSLLPPVASVQAHPNDPYITVDQEIEFTVTDETELRAVIVLVRFDDIGEYEVAYDGTSFATRYSTSTFTASNLAFPEKGGTFTLRRNEGWPSNPTLVIQAFDSTGKILGDPTP